MTVQLKFYDYNGVVFHEESQPEIQTLLTRSKSSGSLVFSIPITKGGELNLLIEEFSEPSDMFYNRVGVFINNELFSEFWIINVIEGQESIQIECGGFYEYATRKVVSNSDFSGSPLSAANFYWNSTDGVGVNISGTDNGATEEYKGQEGRYFSQIIDNIYQYNSEVIHRNRELIVAESVGNTFPTPLLYSSGNRNQSNCYAPTEIRYDGRAFGTTLYAKDGDNTATATITDNRQIGLSLTFEGGDLQQKANRYLINNSSGFRTFAVQLEENTFPLGSIKTGDNVNISFSGRTPWSRISGTFKVTETSINPILNNRFVQIITISDKPTQDVEIQDLNKRIKRLEDFI